MTNDEEVLLSTITPFSAPSESRLDTTKWFDQHHTAQEQSPIDEFIENLYGINRLYLQANERGEYTPMLGSLVYLGMVSAAEGYFRSLLRRLILVDPACEANASARMVSYAAAVHHQPELLPEALLEGVSLASTKNVVSELRSLCNLSQFPAPIEKLFENFEDICQIRHCGIHRFGKLGSQQALRLGMDRHKPLLEKPLTLTVSHLQDIAEALEALIRAVNSFCFFDMLKRTHNASPAGKDKKPLYSLSWNRDWSADESRYKEYYSIFASKRTASPSASAEDTYVAFMSYIRATETGGR